MPKESRLQDILNILDEHSPITAEQLSQNLFTSLPTIYRDLRELSRRKLIVHNRGLVQRAQPQTVTTPLDFRRAIQAKEKAAIAKAAAGLIQPGSTVFIDASTTASYLIPELEGLENITVLTNGLVTAMLLKRAGIRTYCLGGGLVENSLAVSGQSTIELVRRFQIDTMLFSAYGISTSGMIVDPSEGELSHRVPVRPQQVRQNLSLQHGPPDSRRLSGNGCTSHTGGGSRAAAGHHRAGALNPPIHYNI